MAETLRQTFAVNQDHPELIQGGMGVAVSGYELASTVARAGEKHGKRVLGVISGTGLPIVLVDRLQRGHPDTVRALKAFNPDIAQEILHDYATKLPGERRKLPPKPEVLVTGSDQIKGKMTRLAVAAAYVEVMLAKEGHDNPIGINVLEKVQLVHLPTILGAMLAGVDYVLVGAGIPHQFPQMLDDFASGAPASYAIDVAGSHEQHVMTLDPRAFLQESKLKRPRFFPIVSSHVLAMRLARMNVDGFIVEGPTAGGHNAPARGKEIDVLGQPIYGEKDEPDLEKIAKLGLPFWLAGGTAGKLQLAQQLGAAGVQVGSSFALSNNSGMRKDIAGEIRRQIADGTLRVVTSATASPSGYPFQVVQLEGTLSDPEVYHSRERVCSLGYLAQAFINGHSGGIGFRCRAEPVNVYTRKGGKEENTDGAVCLCNGLAATVGHGGEGEPPIATLGKEWGHIKKLIDNSSPPNYSYTAEDVVASVFSAT